MQTKEKEMLNELSGEMIEEGKAAKRAYEKQWRANNKDKVRAKNQRYWIKRAMMMRDQKAKEESDGN